MGHRAAHILIVDDASTLRNMLTQYLCERARFYARAIRLGAWGQIRKNRGEHNGSALPRAADIRADVAGSPHRAITAIKPACAANREKLIAPVGLFLTGSDEL